MAGNDKIIEARRVAFEVYVLREHGELDKCGESGEYCSDLIHGAWLGYNAALDSLCVELPLPVKRAFHEYDMGYNEALDHCENAIHAAGVKTK